MNRAVQALAGLAAVFRTRTSGVSSNGRGSCACCQPRSSLRIALVGAVALAASAVVFFVSENAPVIFALAGVVGIAATLVRPAQQSLLPSLARTSES